MLANWQTWIAALLCLVAAAYIARRTWRSFAVNKSGCGTGCGSCSSKSESAQPMQLMSIESDGGSAESKI